MAGCLGYLAMSFTGFLFPAYESRVSLWTQPLTIGELVFMLWLPVLGAKQKAPAPASA